MLVKTVVKKITHGYVVQTFTISDHLPNEWTSQEFVAGDQVEYETEGAETLENLNAERFAELAGGTEPYLPFDMVQPGGSFVKKLQALVGETEVPITRHIEKLMTALVEAVSK